MHLLYFDTSIIIYYLYSKYKGEIRFKKKIKIYAEHIEKEALHQFNAAMMQDSNVQGALMPDAHTGYTLPIGAVIKSIGEIYPAYVGYDIGCGVCGVKLDITKEDIDLEQLKEHVFNNIILNQQHTDYELGDSTEFANKAFRSIGKKQLGTLGGGNHFIELGTGKDGKVWIIIHSGSRKFGAMIAEHYMNIAISKNVNYEKFRETYGNMFESKNTNFKIHNYEKFKIAKEKYIEREISKYIKSIDVEGHYSLDIKSKEGQDYIKDMNCALDYALANRKAMIDIVKDFLGQPDELMFINRHHNHAEITKDGYVIHRKGATHAEDGMLGVIPGNMKDGSFVVVGKGCKESMNSSSHGAGRVLSRRRAKDELDLEQFHKDMEGIVTNHTDATIDESPRAYKNIFEVIELQKDLVEVIDHVVPFFNIKE